MTDKMSKSSPNHKSTRFLKNTTDPTSPTKKVTSRRMEKQKGEVASVKSELKRVWVQTAAAEERTVFLESLVKEGLGTKDVEKYEANQADMRFGNKRGEINKKAIMEDMERKICNSKEEESRTRRSRGRLRKRLEDLLGNRTDAYKNCIRKIKEKIRRIKMKTRENNLTKITRYKKKKKTILMENAEDNRSLPEGWKRYEEVKAFNVEEIMPEPPKMPVTIVGGEEEVVLSEDEVAILKRGPKYALRKALSKEKYMVEVEKAITKDKYERRNREENESEKQSSKRMETSEEMAELKRVEDLIMEEEGKSRMIFQQVGKDLDFGRAKATDWKANKRVYLPRALPPEIEAMYELRRSEAAKIFDRCKELLEDETKDDNLTAQEKRGMKSLQKRIANEEIIVCQTRSRGVPAGWKA